MSTTTFTKGSRVNFLPGPKSSARVDGTVENVINSGTGKGASTFLEVKCDDGKTRKIRPGSCTAA